MLQTSRHRHKKRHLRVEPLECRHLLAADVLISEFVASNDSTLADRDGDSSDWLELFNKSHTTVDLDGWHLTDDASELDKWRLPAVAIEPGEFLVVFASGKDRAVAAAELHTNFKLSTDGEFLALVEPDGRTISHAYNPFPQQFTDVSYGTRSETVVSELIGEGADSRAFLPRSATQDLPAGVWSLPAFDDSAWRSGSVGLGFSDGRFDTLIAENGDLSQMQGDTASAYVRLPFQITDAVSSYDQLELTVNYDDGFVAYLNGTRVADRNAPQVLNWESAAAAEHGGVLSSLDFDGFAAPEGLNLVGASTWIPNALRLTEPDPLDSGAVWTSEPLQFGLDFSFSAYMEIDVTAPGGASDDDGTGGQGMAFVLQSGGRFQLGDAGGALGLDNSGMQFVAVEFDSWSDGSFDPDDSLPSHIGVDSNVHGNVARVAVPRFNGSDSTNPRYVWVDYDGVGDQFEVYFSAANEKPSEPTLSTALDLQSLFEDSPSLWAGWTAANGEETWNRHAVHDFTIVTTAEHAFEAETIDLSDFLNELRPGDNVLAIHGLNASVDDDDFLIKPTLVATQSNFINLDARGYFSTPTPGEPNVEPTAAPSGDVAFSITGRTFAEPFDLAITAESPDAEIRYTTDGSIPDEDAMLYTQPMRINTSTRVRARAYEPGKAAGPVTSHGYIALSSALTEFEGGVFESNLPLMVFHSFGGNVDANASNLVPVASVFINNTDGQASLLDEPEFAGRAGLRIRGQSSQGWPKKQYALEMWDEGNSDTRPIAASRTDDLSVSVFGLPAESDWVLNGPYSDKTQLNNYLTFQWSNAIGQYAPRTRLVEVFVRTRAGALDFRTDYRGTYALLEKIKIDEQRVNIAALSPGATEEPEISGGYIWKYDKDGAGDVNFTTTFQQRFSSNRPWKFVEPQRPPAAQRDWLKEYLTEFESVLYGRNFDDPAEGYAKYIDVDSWIDTWLLVEFTKNIDGFRLSTYYYKDRGGKIKQGPAWDYNLSLANANYLNGAVPTGWYHDQLGTSDYPYWDRLFRDANFEIRVRDRWFELRKSVFSTENLLADIDEAVGQLTDNDPRLGNPPPGEPSNPISRNFERWRTLGTYLWPNCFFGTGACPTSPLPNRARPDSYDDYIFILKDFVETRAAWIDSQFRAPPEIAPPGGVMGGQIEVSITPVSSGTVYYTLDGSDPREETTGRVSVNAIEYESPFNITENVIVQSRVQRGRGWSAKASQTYYVTIPTITISELNYNPAPPSAAELAAGFTDNDDFEFIELLNYGSEPVSLANTRFVKGVEVLLVDTVVEPGEHVVVVGNQDAFRRRYGGVARIVGEYSNPLDAALDFRLRNSGEELVMIGALGEPILDFSYADAWYPLTDGDGFSLVRREPLDAAIEDGRNAWRPSDFVGGSPGAIEAGVSPDPGAVVINEMVSNSSGPQGDIVELLNRTNRSIPVGGFFFTDDIHDPTKFRIPAGTQIPASKYLLLDRRVLGPSFQLSARGGELMLQGAIASRSFTGFREIVEFGASEMDSSWGRYETSIGSEFTPMSSVTLGGPNAPPKIGPVVINEIQYHPEPDDHEFIELRNISDESVAIADWGFDRGIDFRFPVGAEISAGGYVVLMQIPAGGATTELVEAFRRKHEILDEVEIFFYTDADGSLDNAGEQLVLKMPLAGSLSTLVADRIDYNDDTPWTPRADGLGPSLSRVLSEAYGNDPANWKSSVVGGTPGATNVFEDITPPTVPRNLAAKFLPTGDIALGWSPSLDSDGVVARYGIYRDGRLVGSSAIPYYSDAVGWTAGQTVTYQVSAFNADGFQSDRSNAVEVSPDSTSHQQGVQRYSGAADAQIDESDPDENMGDISRLLVDGNNGGSSNAAASSLFRWSDLSIPSDTMVVGASISLNILNAGDTYEIKQVRKEWNEQEVTWNQASDGRPWQVAGAIGDEDVGVSIGMLETSSAGYVTFHLNSAGIEMIRGWLEDPASNHGVMVADPGNSTDSVIVESLAGRTTTTRPKLTIFHAPQPQIMQGDFNLDDVVNAADIDLIHAALRADVGDPFLDLDGDGTVTEADVDVLVTDVIGTVRGDANLDGNVGFDDFVRLAAAFEDDKHQRWDQGDFDGDGRTTFADFVLLAGNYFDGP